MQAACRQRLSGSVHWTASAITVYATQDTVENDSFNNQYDKNATYPVKSAAELKEALADGGSVSVSKDIKTDNIGDTVADRVIISNPTTLNLDAKIVSPDDMGNNSTNFCALIVDANTTINATEMVVLIQVKMADMQSMFAMVQI